MYRLMKATHEYGAGTATYYQTTSKSWNRHGSAGRPCAKTAKNWLPVTCTN
jgi:hypothetical protein